MSKLTKLVNNPELFLKDMVEKRVPIELKQLIKNKLKNKENLKHQNNKTI